MPRLFKTSVPLFKTTNFSLLSSSSTMSQICMSNYSDALVAGSPNPEQQRPWLIVGLGNPRKIFGNTRHNAGSQMVDAIAEAGGISLGSVSFKALFGEGSIGGVPVMLAKPQTFMNSSGESVGAIVSYYKIPLKQVVVVFDDLDLLFGKLRLLPKGGHGGHNGMRSVIGHLGSSEFPRLRIGIGRPPLKWLAINFFLGSFTKQEQEELNVDSKQCKFFCSRDLTRVQHLLIVPIAWNEDVSLKR